MLDTSALISAATATATRYEGTLKKNLSTFIQTSDITPVQAEHLVRQVQAQFNSLTPELSELIIHSAQKIAYSLKNLNLAVGLLSILAQKEPDNFECLTQLALQLQTLGHTQEGLAVAYQARRVASHNLNLLFANYIIMRGMMMACNGYFIDHVAELRSQMIEQLRQMANSKLVGNSTQMIRLYSVNFWHPYFIDEPQQFRQLLTYTHQAVGNFLTKNFAKTFTRCQELKNKPTDFNHIKIGFIGHTFTTHSVGYLLRHLISHLDLTHIHLFAIMLLPRPRGTDPLQDWYESKMYTSRQLSVDGPQIAEDIAELELDILIDLDSITLDVTQAVMAFHPAKVTMSWLGFDAASNPGTDYYLIDKFSLPPSEAHYYEEQPLYLDHLVGVNGFESGLPSIKRSDLGIKDEFVFLVIQRSSKLHPYVFDCYMKILAKTDAILVLKTPGDNDLVKNFVRGIAQQQGVDQSRIRYMPVAANEQVHRANITAIADCILDSYPYSGATTTLESLWNLIPVVTLCGQQVSARTTASFITALDCDYLGVADTDHEFITKAVTLKQDPERYQEYKHHLHMARIKNKGIWDAQTFAQNFKNTILSVLD